MKTALRACALGATLLAGCGGGGSSGGAGAPSNPSPPPPATVTVDTVVYDGLIKGATVCLDINNNRRCDAGEPASGKTDANGKASIANVASADLAKYPMLAEVPADAVDADEPTQTVGTRFTLSAPPGTPGFISPVTTLVENFRRQHGSTVAYATAEIRDMMQLSGSPLSNVAGKTDAESQKVSDVGRLVATTWRNWLRVEGANMVESDDMRAQINDTIQRRLVDLLPLMNYYTSTGKLDAAAMTAVLADLKLRADLGDYLKVRAAAEIDARFAAVPIDTSTPTAGSLLTYLDYRDPANYIRIAEVSTADDMRNLASTGSYTYTRMRLDIANGVNDPNISTSGPRTYFNGQGWVECPAGLPTVTAPNADGERTRTSCNFAKTRILRHTIDVSGMSLYDLTRMQSSLPAALTSFYFDSVPTSLKVTLAAGAKAYINTYRSHGHVLSYVPTSRLPGANGNAVSLEDFTSRHSAPVANPGSTLTAANSYRFMEYHRTQPAPVTVDGELVRLMGNMEIRVGFGPGNTARYYRCNIVSTSSTGKFAMNSLFGCTVIAEATASLAARGDARVLSVPVPFAVYRETSPTGTTLTESMEFIERGASVYIYSKNALVATRYFEANEVVAAAFNTALGLR